MYLVKEYIQLHFITLLWGFTAILGLLIEIPVVEMVFFRTLIAAIGLYLIVVFRNLNFKIGKREIAKITATGLIFAAHWILFFASARAANASVSLVGFATTTLWISLLEPLIAGSKFRGFELIIGLVVITGVYVIFQADLTLLLGLSLGISAAVLAGFFAVFNKIFVRKHDPFVITFYEMIGACLGTTLFFPVYLASLSKSGSLELSPSFSDWIYIAILAIACTVYAYSISVKLMEKLTAYAVSLVVNLEPVYGIVLAILILGESEKMSLGFYAGSGIIIAAVFSYPVIIRRLKKKENG